MTSAQWAEAFATNDPEEVGKRIYNAVLQAADEMSPGMDRTTWDEVDRTNQKLYVRAGQILQEGESRTASDPEQAEQGPRDLNAERDFDSTENAE